MIFNKYILISALLGAAYGILHTASYRYFCKASMTVDDEKYVDENFDILSMKKTFMDDKNQ